jgi:hypothetical protein
MKPIAILLVVSAAIIATACGGSSSASDDPTPGGDATTNAAPDQPTSATPVGGEPYPEGLIDAFVACLEALGYDLSVAGEVGMPDGSSFITFGSGLQHPPLSYTNDEFDCRASSGIAAFAGEQGYGNSPIDEEQARQYDREIIAFVQCMTERGWDITPPVFDKTRGRLVMVHEPDPGDRAAYDVDFNTCNTELLSNRQ